MPVTLSQPRQLRGFTVFADGRIIGPSGKQLTPFLVKGYLRVTRYTAGKFHAEPVHRLVCEAYHGSPVSSRSLVRHLDGDPLNNHADNLAWGTGRDNERDKANHGRHLSGERHHQARLTWDQVDAIRARPDSVTHTDLAREYGVTRQTIANIRNGRSWKHAS